MKYLYSLGCALLTMALTAQTEPYSRELLDLPWGSGKLTTYMAFEPMEGFQLAGEKVVDWGVFYNEDSTKMVHVESLVLVNAKEKVYLQLMYANDKLYAKSAGWFFEADDVEGVESKYRHLNGMAVSDAWMLAVHRNKVVGVETESETGVVTRYTGPQDHHNARVINVGYAPLEDMVNATSDNDVVGFYVFGELINTVETPLDNSFAHPVPELMNMRPESLHESFR